MSKCANVRRLADLKPACVGFASTPMAQTQDVMPTSICSENTWISAGGLGVGAVGGGLEHVWPWNLSYSS